MKILILFSFLSTSPDSTVLQKNADLLSTQIHSEFELNSYELSKIFGRKTKISQQFRGNINENITQHFLALKVGKDFFDALLWMYNGEVLKVTCFLDTEIFGEPIEKIATSTQDEVLQGLNKVFMAKYGYVFPIEDLDPRHVDAIMKNRLGVACGAAGIPPKTGIEFVKLLERNDVKNLIQWTTSLSPARRVYGYVGLKVLGYSGVNIIELRMKKDASEVYFCSGCTVHKYLTIGNLFSSPILNELIAAFEKNRTVN